MTGFLAKFPERIGLEAIPGRVSVSVCSALWPNIPSVKISENPNQERSPISR